MAQRCVIVKIGDPIYSDAWEADVDTFIDTNRQAIVADCIGALQAPAVPLARYSRWATWERAVLSRLSEPNEVQRVIADRQGETDVEREDAEIITEFFQGQLTQLGYDTERDVVFIPSPASARWLEWATHERRNVNAAGRVIGQFIDEGRLPRLSRPGGKSHGRGVIFTGEHADVEETTKHDLNERVAKQMKAKGS